MIPESFKNELIADIYKDADAKIKKSFSEINDDLKTRCDKMIEGMKTTEEKRRSQSILSDIKLLRDGMPEKKIRKWDKKSTFLLIAAICTAALLILGIAAVPLVIFL